VSEVVYIPTVQLLTKPKYVPQRIAAEYFSVSERTLLTMRQKGMLIEGTCWRRKIPQNPNSHVLYHLDNCEEVLLGLQRSRSMEQDHLIKKKEVASA
tara:strand:+ start:387 stop:677 length:291 start_codon:yes stop_codon:yes gene_type:complete